MRNGNRFCGNSFLDTTIITHKEAIIASERRIRGILMYKKPIALRKGRRNRIMEKGKTVFSLSSKPVFNFKVTDKSRLYSMKKTINVNKDIATVSGTVDKG
jgi:hypothetical protein